MSVSLAYDVISEYFRTIMYIMFNFDMSTGDITYMMLVVVPFLFWGILCVFKRMMIKWTSTYSTYL